MKKSALSYLCFILLFVALYQAFTIPSIYNNSLGLIAKTWTNVDGQRSLQQQPYLPFGHGDFVNWDADHYKLIKDQGYSIKAAGGDYIFAFFPAFPALWYVSGLGPIGVSLLNLLLFTLGLLILFKALKPKLSDNKSILLILTLPCLVIFMIPYTEALFMLFLSIMVYGLVKKKYWILFIGLYFASLTRPAYTILLCAILGTELILFLEHGKPFSRLKSFGLKALPLILGTATVSIIQGLYGSGHPFKYIQVQKYWNNILRMPGELNDWSQEGYSIHIIILAGIFVPILIYLSIRLIKSFKGVSTKLNELEYLKLLSLFYLVGTSLFIIAFRGGTLNCLFRFSLCPPFVFCLFLLPFPKIEQLDSKKKFLALFGVLLVAILLFSSSDYSSRTNFSDLGTLLMLGSLGFWLFKEHARTKAFNITLYIFVGLNLLWTTYLLNSYLNDSWIFA